MRILAFILIALLPLSARAESRTAVDVLEGFVEIVIEDYLREQGPSGDAEFYSVTRHYLEVNGKRIELTGGRLPDDLRTGEFLRLEGRLDGDRFDVASVLALGPGKLSGKAAGLFSGPQNLIVIPIELQNVEFAASCSYDRIDTLAIEGATSMTKWWDEVSYGNLWFDPEVSFTHPVITVPSTYDGTCDLTTWTAQADFAVGDILTQYNRRVYVIPSSLTNCPLGLGQLGNPGLPVTLNWVRGCNFPDTFQHEMGHNFNLRHANTLTQEYADTSDIMGFATGSIRKLNAPHTEDVGWLDQTEPYYKTVAAVGVHDEQLLALGRDYVTNPQTQILKIFAPSLGKNLYVSYRDRNGMDATLHSSYTYDTAVHLSDGTASILRASLDDNEQFAVPADGITIRQLSHDLNSGTAMVRVIIETPTDCDESTPTLRLAEQTPLYVVPGGSVDYRIEITNNDSSTCNPALFEIKSTLPNTSWSNNAPVLMELEAGETGVSPPLTITSSTNATNPRYLLSMVVIVPDDFDGEHTALLSNVEFKTDAFPPSAPALSVDLVDGIPMLAWTDSTDVQSGVAFYDVYESPGTLEFVKTGETTDTSAPGTTTESDMIWYKVVAVDNVGNRSDAVE